jgi:hypothetical protein
MALQSPHNSVNDWVADSGASHRATHSTGNISNPHPLNSASPSSIVVGNDSTLPVALVGDSLFPDHSTVTIFCWLLTLLKIFFLFVALPLIIGVLWSLTLLVYL